MYMKNILILGAIIIVVLSLILVFGKPKETSAPAPVPVDTATNTDTEAIPTTTETPTTKLKADTFTGTLTKVDTGCFADGECFVEVDGKKVTALIGFSRDEVGSVIGVDGFGDLESFIGKQVEVYAQDNSDGTYTLYGSKGFYIKTL
jgi:hypothetical protein